MFHVKICGITNSEDALVAVAAGADAIGLNFYSPSPRSVTNERAAEIAAELPIDVARIGVFVNADATTIRTTTAAVGLDWIQLHGDERPRLLADLPDGVRLIRAFRLHHNDDLAAVIEYVGVCRTSSRIPDAILLDAFDPIRFGGTGLTLPWKILQDGRLARLGLPILLAGGLTPDNVADAIRQAGPGVTAVDTASGVESSPGVKDSDKVRQFVEHALAALAR